MSRPRVLALLLAFITLAAYLPASRFGFVNYDDDDYVTNNPEVQKGLTFAGVKWAFTTGHASNWHPLTWLSHMTDCELFKLNAGAHHLVSALFHATNAALLFILLLRLTGKTWPSALVAALFAWHPLHVESVAWISERKDVLSTFFALLALLSYAKYARENSRRGYWLALLFFALGLMAKPMLVTLPCVLLLLDCWPLGRIKNDKLRIKNLRPLLPEKIPFFILSAASCAATFLVQRGGHAVASLGQIPLRFRLENAPVAVARYLLKLAWPADLAVIYPLARISIVELMTATTLLLLISILAWRWRQSRPFFITGWLWFLGTLVPVIGLVQVGSAALADRYTYIPSIGIFLALVFLAAEFLQKIRAPKIISGGGAVLILAAGLLATEHQLRFWRDSETLFRHALAVTQDNDVAHVDLGVALDQQGRTADALAEYHAAAHINPDRPQTHFNLGVMLDKSGRPADALPEYRAAIRLDPRNATAHSAAGSDLAALGKFAEAMKEFAEAEKLDPAGPTPHTEAARALFLQGRDTEAVDELRAALRASPENYTTLALAAHYLAANENAAARDGQNALILALKANELSGHSQPMVFDILGMAFAETGDFTNAATCAQNALDLAAAAQLKNTEPIRARRELYRQNRAWHESFLATNAPPKN